MKIQIQTHIKRLLADTFTPVSIYLKVRDRYTESVLLESTDFRSVENCFSFIGIEPIARFMAQGQQLTEQRPNQAKTVENIDFEAVLPRFKQFLNQFDIENPVDAPAVVNGFLGHTSYDAVQYFDTLRFDASKRRTDLPDMHYALYRFVIAINHFKDELTIIENCPKGEASRLEALESLLNTQVVPTFDFKMVGEETSNLSNDDFKAFVAKGKYHCQIGDVFQIVLSRNFAQAFEGDDFQVYRALRSINPSPYLFYFDNGGFSANGSGKYGVS